MFKVKVTKSPLKQNGGPVPETQGVPHGQGTAELEEGEVYKDDQGGLQKIAEGAGTHDEGGVEVDDAHKVLEDTADKRDDSDSKTLKMTPDEVKQVTGFEPEKGLSHSKAFEKSWEFYEKKITKLQNKLKKNVKDAGDYNSKYAKNSMELNLEQLLNLPSQGELFDKLFAHQELTKKIAGIDPKTRQQQVGGVPGDYQYQAPEGQPPTIKVKLTNNRIPDQTSYENDKLALRPFDKVYNYYKDNFGYQGDPNDIGSWQKWVSQNAKTKPELLNYLKSVPLTNKGRQLYGNVDPKTLNADQLTNQFNDNMYDFRAPRLQLPGGPDMPSPKPDSPLPKFTPFQPNPPQQQSPPSQGTTYPGRPQPQGNKFNEPLRWYDVAGDLASLADSGREPVKLNPVNFQAPQVHELDPRPELQAGQSNYNALLRTLPSNGVGMSNLATIYAQKYGIDDRILGAYENQNKQRLDQRDQINASTHNQQQVADQSSRETFERKYLGSLEAQRQQRMLAFNDMMDKIAQNHKLNTEGNLIMSTIHNYDQKGNFTGNKGPIVSNPNTSPLLQGTGNQTFTTTNPKTGQQETWMKTTVDGKPKLTRVS
jgi:hypothetical protein